MARSMKEVVRPKLAILFKTLMNYQGLFPKFHVTFLRQRCRCERHHLLYLIVRSLALY